MESNKELVEFLKGTGSMSYNKCNKLLDELHKLGPDGEQL